MELILKGGLKMINPELSILIHGQASVDGKSSTIMSARIPFLNSNLRTNITTTDNGPGASSENRTQNIEDMNNFREYVYYVESEIKNLINKVQTFNEFMGYPEESIQPTIPEIVLFKNSSETSLEVSNMTDIDTQTNLIKKGE